MYKFFMHVWKSQGFFLSANVTLDAPYILESIWLDKKNGHAH